jgi:hypothetical protein
VVGVLRDSFRFRVEQTVQMHDEVPYVRVVHGLLRLRSPRLVGFGVIRIDADDVDVAQILEFHVFEPRQFSAQHEVQQLFRLRFLVHL